MHYAGSKIKYNGSWYIEHGLNKKKEIRNTYAQKKFMYHMT